VSRSGNLTSLQDEEGFVIEHTPPPAPNPKSAATLQPPSSDSENEEIEIFISDVRVMPAPYLSLLLRHFACLPSALFIRRWWC
jgi:hypothetical protein